MRISRLQEVKNNLFKVAELVRGWPGIHIRPGHQKWCSRRCSATLGGVVAAGQEAPTQHAGSQRDEYGVHPDFKKIPVCPGEKTV